MTDVEEHDNHEEPDPEYSDNDLLAEIDELLADARPDRYDAEDQAWKDAIFNKVAKRLSALSSDEVREQLALAMVNRREKAAQDKARRIVREFFRDGGQLPLGWPGDEDWTNTLGHRMLRFPLILPDRTRVVLGAMLKGDLKDVLEEEARRRDASFIASEEFVNGIARFMQLLDEQGVEIVKDLRQGSD